MNKKHNKIQEVQTSKLAIKALLIPVLMWCMGVCFFGIAGFPSTDSAITRSIGGFIIISAIILVFFSGPVGVVLGIKALHEIKKSTENVKGKRLAIEGIILSIVLELVFFAYAFAIADIARSFSI